MSQKNYVIIGGSHGIGLALVKRLAAGGDQVIVVSRTAGDLSELPHVVHLQADVTVDTVSSLPLPAFIHGLAYCPGSINLGPVRGLQPAAMISDYELNVVGEMLTSFAACNESRRFSFDVDVQHRRGCPGTAHARSGCCRQRCRGRLDKIAGGRVSAADPRQLPCSLADRHSAGGKTAL
jgi:short chain dehydrogenase